MKEIAQWLSMALTNNISTKAFFEPLIQLLFSKWRVNSYRAGVIEIRNENNNVYSLILKVSKRWENFKPGQHVELTVEQNGVLVSRVFSIPSAPGLYRKYRKIELTISKQPKGRITPWLNKSLKIGQYVNLSAAAGKFIIANKSQSTLLIAGGAGITPFRSMILEARHIEKIHLMYFAQKSNHLFIQELRSCMKTNTNLKVTFIDSKESGHISIVHLNQYCPDFRQRKIYVCGPFTMIESTKQLLLDNKVSHENICYEYFGERPIDNLDIKTVGTVRFNKSDIEIKPTVNKPQSLLTMAESIGLKPMTGCRMGICHQCICQKQQGIVYNTITNAFSDTGSEEVQLCVSVPVGNVSINL